MTTLFSSPPLGETRADKEAHCRARLAICQAQLGWALDALIPADRDLGMPSATEAGVLTTYLVKALMIHDDHLEGFVASTLKLPAIEPADPIAVLTGLDKADFNLFSRTVAGAFFMNEAVNTKLGYHGQQAIRNEPDYDTMFELIEPVAERGPVYTFVS